MTKFHTVEATYKGHEFTICYSLIGGATVKIEEICGHDSTCWFPAEWFNEETLKGFASAVERAWAVEDAAEAINNMMEAA